MSFSEGDSFGLLPADPRLIVVRTVQQIGSEVYRSEQYVSYEQFQTARIDLVEEAWRITRRQLWNKAEELNNAS